MLPLDDRHPYEILADPRPQPEPDRDTYVYYPDTADVPESVAANTRGRSFKILADVEITSPDAEGVIFAHGSRFGGHALFLKDRKLWYVYNFLGIPPEQQFVSDALEPGKHVLGMEFAKEIDRRARRGARHDEALRRRGGRRRRARCARSSAQFTLCGDGLCVGRDSADAGQQGVHGRRARSRAGRSSRSRSTSATTSTSTSRSRRPR